MSFQTVSRQRLIVWLYSLKHVKKVQKIGSLHYVSRKMRYAVLYVSEAELDQALKQLKQLFFVRSVEVAPRVEMQENYSDVLQGLREKLAAEGEPPEPTLLQWRRQNAGNSRKV